MGGSSPSSTVTLSKSCTINTLNASASRSPNDTHVRMGRRTFCACHHLSYGKNKIRAAIPTKMATKRPGITTTSMITSWVDGGFDYGFLWIG
jgi:hypothetical protein